MAVPARLAVFGAALLVVFVLAFGVGRAMEDGAPERARPVQADDGGSGGFGGHGDHDGEG